MIVKVEGCWEGRPDKFHFRLTTSDGKRFVVNGADWTRQLARVALDLLEHAGYTRKNIRFAVR